MANLRNGSTNCMKQSVYTFLGTVQTTSHVCHSGLCPPQRTFSRTSQLAKSKNFYDDLEIPKTSTQSEIKAAYYNLSKAYHPDKNQTVGAANKFRKITQAYEVLGNFRTRRMYDKGIGSFGKSSNQSPGMETEIVNEPVEDDAQTKFYKQYMVKSQVPDMVHNPTARNFDTWSSQRITASFQRRQLLKEIHRHHAEDEEHAKFRTKQVSSIKIALILLVCFGVFVEERHRRLLEKDIKKLRESKS